MKAIITIIFFSSGAFFYCRGQQPDLNSIINRLKDNSGKQVLLSDQVMKELEKTDSNTFRSILDKVKDGGENNSYLQARSFLLDAEFFTIYRTRNPAVLATVENWFEKALKKSLELDDELLIAQVCGAYGLFCDRYELFEKAMFYSLKSIDLQEKNGLEKFSNPAGFYLAIGDILYKVGEYGLCIRQLKKGIALLQPPLSK